MSDKRVVSPIEMGCVIDHIPVGMGLTLLHVLDLEGTSYVLLSRVTSNKVGVKDIVKVFGYELSEEQLRTTSIIAHGATYNLIKDSKVFNKETLNSPYHFERLAQCPNPKCITNYAQVGGITQKFVVRKPGEEIECHYCEKSFSPRTLDWMVRT